MPILLFKLQGVSDQEADEVRSLLESNSIRFYETTAGRWGVSMPGIWLPDEEQHDEAVSLLQSYQQERSRQFREDYELLVQSGNQPSLWSNFWQRPIRFTLAVVAVIFVIGLSLYPFLDLIGIID
jgi:hypothetical protein